MTFISFSSCKKDDQNPNEELCNTLKNIHPHPFLPVTKGDQINISVDYLDGTSYIWQGPNYISFIANPTVTNSANYKNRGWYYVEMTHLNCQKNYDSVYVDVKFPQGVPSCTLTDNTATLSGIGTQLYTSISFQPGSVGFEIIGHSIDGDMVIKMSEYWRSHTLEDGIYYTSHTLPSSSEIDKICIVSHNQGNPNTYCFSDDGQPVYISHVGGKARLAFCGVTFQGYLWTGDPYTTNIDAQITQP